jgi:hypothetical protein
MADTKIRNLPVTGSLDDDDCFVVATNSTTDTCSIKWSDMASEIGLLNQITSLEARLSTPVLKCRFVAKFFGNNGFQYNLNSLVPNYSSSDIVKVLIDKGTSYLKGNANENPTIHNLPETNPNATYPWTLVGYSVYEYKRYGGILYTGGDSSNGAKECGIVEVWGAI